MFRRQPLRSGRDQPRHEVVISKDPTIPPVEAPKIGATLRAVQNLAVLQQLEVRELEVGHRSLRLLQRPEQIFVVVTMRHRRPGEEAGLHLRAAPTGHEKWPMTRPRQETCPSARAAIAIGRPTPPKQLTNQSTTARSSLTASRRPLRPNHLHLRSRVIVDPALTERSDTNPCVRVARSRVTILEPEHPWLAVPHPVPGIIDGDPRHYIANDDAELPFAKLLASHVPM